MIYHVKVEGITPYMQHRMDDQKLEDWNESKKGLRWVKASERLPDTVECEIVYRDIQGSYNIQYVAWDTKLTASKEFFEWLDEGHEVPESKGRWVNIYRDQDGRFLSNEDFASYQEAYDNKDPVTYIETVQIISHEVPAQSFEEILEGYHVTLEKNRMFESIKLAAEKYASQFKGHEVPDPRDYAKKQVEKEEGVYTPKGLRQSHEVPDETKTLLETNELFADQIIKMGEEIKRLNQKLDEVPCRDGEQIVYVLADVKEVPLLQKEREQNGFIPIDGDVGHKWLKPVKLSELTCRDGVAQEALIDVLKGFRDGYDHDEDAHKYGHENTQCRVCIATNTLNKIALTTTDGQK